MMFFTHFCDFGLHLLHVLGVDEGSFAGSLPWSNLWQFHWNRMIIMGTTAAHSSAAFLLLLLVGGPVPSACVVVVVIRHFIIKGCILVGARVVRASGLGVGR